jgi:hypothetical protein
VAVNTHTYAPVVCTAYKQTHLVGVVLAPTSSEPRPNGKPPASGQLECEKKARRLALNIAKLPELERTRQFA